MLGLQVLAVLAAAGASASAGVDVFYVNGTSFARAVYQGEVAAVFQRDEYKTFCPKDPIEVVEGGPDATFVLVADVRGKATLRDLGRPGPGAQLQLLPHAPATVQVNGSCGEHGWGKVRLAVTFEPEAPAGASEYLLRYNFNCRAHRGRFDFGLLLLTGTALLITYFTAFKRRPSGAIGKSLVDEYTSLNLWSVTVWILLFSLAMVLVSYFQPYMDLALRLFYTLLGVFTTHVVFEDLVSLGRRDFLGTPVCNRRRLG